MCSSDLKDAKLVTADASALTLGNISAAATGGDAAKLAELLDRATGEGIGAIEILRTLQYRLQQLHLVRGLMDEGVSLQDALAKLRPPLFFRDKDIFVSQVRQWPANRLSAALKLAVRAEAACKRTGAPDFTIASKACAAVSQMKGKPL